MKRVNVAIILFLTFLLLPQVCWAAPVINSISPTNHNSGSFSVVISGSGFTGASWVRVYNASGVQVASPGFTINSDNQITANANLQAGSYRFRVRTSAGTSNYSPTLTVSSAPPVISTISPATGYTGALTIGIGGNNFTNVSGVSVYNTAGGTRSSRAVNAGYTVNSNSQITATAKLKAGSYYFRVKTSAGSSNNSPALTVTSPPPVISGISPTTNLAGAFNVLISGSNFANIQAVKVYDAVSGSSTGDANYVVNSTSQITAPVNLAAGSFYFRVTTGNGSSNNSPTLTVTSTTPPPPPPPPPPTTSYRLKSPIPGVVNVGTVSEGASTSGTRVMWKDTSSVVHLLAAFGGAENGGWYGNYVNTATGVHTLITGAVKGAGGGWAYHPTYNKLYGGTGYAGNQSSFFEFNPVNQTLTLIYDRTMKAPIGNAVIGDDHRVYQFVQGNTLFSYDPSVGPPNGLKNYGLVLPGLNSGSNYRALGVDTTHIYCGVLKTNGTWTLAITPIAGTPNWVEWPFGSAGDAQVSIAKKEDTHEWFAYRELANGSTKVYWLANGTATDSGLSDVHDEPDLTTITPFCYAAGDEAMYGVLTNAYGWELDFTDLFPVKSIHEFSTVRYRQVGAQTWNESTVGFTGPWVPQTIQCVVPRLSYRTFAVSSGYNASVNLDPTNFTPIYLGANCFSPYESLQHSNGEIYVGGYASKVLRYDPTLPWTLTSAKAAPRLPSDPTKPNPFFIQMTPGDTYHYRHHLDYDNSGKVWIGGNTTRKSPDYGNVMWYNPSDGSIGYLFPGWKSAGETFYNLCAANNRSRICASGAGSIWIIDAATKTVDPNPIVPIAGGSKTYMIEVENDIVFGIVFAPGPTYKVIRFRPSTKEILTLQGLGVSGTPFGFDDTQYDRMNYKLELGPDGYVWMFVGDSLYRVNPATCVFTKILDTAHGKVKFASNKVDLLLYNIDGTTDFKYIPGILEAVSP